jgi:glucose-6-phosphate-specific signal transduction histidine kinase
MKNSDKLYHIIGYAIFAPFVGGFAFSLLTYEFEMGMAPWRALVLSLIAGMIAPFFYFPLGLLFGVISIVPIRLPRIYLVMNICCSLAFMYFVTREDSFNPYRTWLLGTAVLFGVTLTFVIQSFRNAKDLPTLENLEKNSN